MFPGTAVRQPGLLGSRDLGMVLNHLVPICSIPNIKPLCSIALFHAFLYCSSLRTCRPRMCAPVLSLLVEFLPLRAAIRNVVCMIQNCHVQVHISALQLVKDLVSPLSFQPHWDNIHVHQRTVVGGLLMASTLLCFTTSSDFVPSSR